MNETPIPEENFYPDENIYPEDNLYPREEWKPAIKNIRDIGKSECTMTESQLQTCVAILWLKLGIPGMDGGVRLAHWLEENIDKIENIFGADDRVYIKCKDAKTNAELAQLLIDHKIGNSLQWKKCKGSDRWWLLVWWDL